MKSAGVRKVEASEAASIVEGEFLFTFEDFRQIAEMLHADAGIALPESKATLVYSRLAKRLRLLGLASFRDYCAMLVDVKGVDERKQMLAALTTNVTRFFREPHHFDHLRELFIEKHVPLLKRGGRVRFWSAGCSTGQEPYSIAMTVLSVLPDAARYDIRILASDIDPNVVAEAKAGCYPGALVDQIPQDMRGQWFAREGNLWKVKPAVAELIAFRELNLIGQWPMQGKFDVIFCRNVVIYFDEETQQKIWKRYRAIMTPGGHLYIGHSERLTGVDESFVTDGMTTYRLQGRGAA